MTRQNPIVIVVLCIVAISILAFTINDELTRNKNKNSLTSSKNVAIASPFVTYNPKHGEPGHRHDLPDGAPIPGTTLNPDLNTGNLTLNAGSATQAVPTPGTSGLNPAHGQPGHRCDIAVGAPLNSAAASTQIATPAVENAPVSGMNPAHGQPGHRCDIAVGAPLNSAPAKTTANTTTTTAAVTNVAPGMNPPHGQPGHRCDIAVGAPLNSAANTTSATVTPTTQSTSPTLFPNYSFPVADPAQAATVQSGNDSTAK